jgi:6-phosphogluconolactonase (cycloisomerase 2 family)
MRKRFTWVLAVAALILAAFTLACSTKYTASSNGLVVVSTWGQAVMDSFSLDLGNGHVAQINNAAGPPTNGDPTTVVLDPAGEFAYVLVNPASNVNGSSTGVQIFPVASDGKLGAGATTALKPMASGTAPCVETINGQPVTVQVPATGLSVTMLPDAMVMDSAGKLLFVADATTSVPGASYSCNGLTVTGTATVPGAISVFTVSGGSLSEVAGSPFPLPLPSGGTTPSASALAVSPTIYPSAYSICSANVPPTTENLYVTDSVNYVVLNYSVASSGVLTLMQPTSSTVGLATGTVPAGVTVDPCNRFVYVSNGQPNDSISAFTICTAVSFPACPAADFRLIPVSGSPFPAGGNAPGPLLMDAYANYLYVLDTGQTSISAFRVSTTTGSLTALSPATVATNSFPTSIAVRNDDSFLFVTNFNSATLSEYSITPATGQLIPLSTVQTDNQPWGVAVK